MLLLTPSVRPFDTCFHTDSLPLFLAEPGTVSVNLSKATRLKDVAFLCGRLGAERVSLTLRAMISNQRNLQQISLQVPDVPYDPTLNRADPANARRPIGEVIHEQWLELDHRFVQLWELYSIRPKLLYYTPQGKDREGAISSVQCLLPEITRRGIADLVRWG